MKEYVEFDMTVGEIKNLINSNYEVLVDSPDGFVEVSEYVDKGIWEEYILTVDNYTVRSNENHLYETNQGWKFAKDLLNLEGKVEILTDKGYLSDWSIKKTGMQIPIVDLVINHPNHRYYTNGISSHNTNVGKSLVMCHVAASTLSQGKNVLYITLEMSEEEIAKRIDANLMNIPIGDLKNLHKDMFNNKIAKIKDKTNGKLIIHEYPTAGAHSGHFRALLNDLRLKKSFTPNMIIIDYLNICSSARLKSAQNVNSYSYIKSIAEEIRGLAVEFDVPILSATQTTRGGINNSDLELTDTSESIGLPATCDLLFAIMRNEELDLLNQILFKQLKNRFNDASLNRKFVVGVDRVKMKLYNIENSAQDSLITSDTSNYNNTLPPPNNSNTKFKRDFSSIKV